MHCLLRQHRFFFHGSCRPQLHCLDCTVVRSGCRNDFHHPCVRYSPWGSNVLGSLSATMQRRESTSLFLCFRSYSAAAVWCWLWRTYCWVERSFCIRGWSSCTETARSVREGESAGQAFCVGSPWLDSGTVNPAVEEGQRRIARQPSASALGGALGQVDSMPALPGQPCRGLLGGARRSRGRSRSGSRNHGGGARELAKAEFGRRAAEGLRPAHSERFQKKKPHRSDPIWETRGPGKKTAAAAAISYFSAPFSRWPARARWLYTTCTHHVYGALFAASHGRDKNTARELVWFIVTRVCMVHKSGRVCLLERWLQALLTKSFLGHHCLWIRGKTKHFGAASLERLVKHFWSCFA